MASIVLRNFDCREGWQAIFHEEYFNIRGSVSFDADWEANVEEGDWSIDRNALAPELQDDWRELESLVNDEIPHGCCGGCI